MFVVSNFIQDAFEPHLSSKLMELHHGTHYKGYVDTMNKLIENNDALNRLSIEDLVVKSFNHGNPLPCFNSAGQVRKKT